jgi:NitT/TauT family transport system substrate-binding protein
MSRLTRAVAKHAVLLMAFWLILIARQPVFATAIKVSYPSTTAYWLPLIVGAEKGFYKKAGLDVQPIFIRGNSIALQALTAGDLHFVAGGTTAGTLAITKGLPITMIMGLYNEPDYEFFASPEIRDLRDLKGKNVAAGTPGSPPDFAIRTALESVGLTENDVQLLRIPSSPDRFAALQQKRAVATSLGLPLNFVAEQMGFKRIGRLKDMIKELQVDVIYASRKTILENPGLIRAFVQGTVDAVRYVKTNKEDSVKILARFSRSSTEIAEKTYDLVMPGIPSKGEFTIPGIQVILDYQAKIGLLQKPVPSPETFITRDVVKP